MNEKITITINNIVNDAKQIVDSLRCDVVFEMNNVRSDVVVLSNNLRVLEQAYNVNMSRYDQIYDRDCDTYAQAEREIDSLYDSFQIQDKRSVKNLILTLDRLQYNSRVLAAHNDIYSRVKGIQRKMQETKLQLQDAQDNLSRWEKHLRVIHNVYEALCNPIEESLYIAVMEVHELRWLESKLNELVTRHDLLIVNIALAFLSLH